MLRVRGLVRGIPGPTEDPAVELLQTWTVTPGVVRHSLTVSTSLESLDVDLEIQLAADFTDMAAIRLSRFRDPCAPFSADDSTLRWRDGGRSLTVAAPGSVAAGERLRWRGTARRGQAFEAEWQAVLADTEDAVVAARPSRPAPDPGRTIRRPGRAVGQLAR
ncbi:glycogen debranching N-terminal domain-containing protein [Pseudarthrobacter sp. So.54]